MTEIVIEPHERFGVIYGLHAGDRRIRYVGQTLRLQARMTEHLHAARSGKSTNPGLAQWLLETELVHVSVLQNAVPQLALLGTEMLWIGEFPAEDLLNVPPSVQYRGRPHSEESRSKIGRGGADHWAYGRRSSKRAFTEDEIEVIRDRVRNGETRKSIALEYGVHKDTIERYTRRRSL